MQNNKQNKKVINNESNLSLRFSPDAWAKLLYFRSKTDNEVGGFGITDKDDLLFVREFAVIKQTVSSVTVKFDDTAIADFFEDQVDSGRTPEQFSRIWLHTHPFDSPYPSQTDINTFERVFGKCSWAVMFILAEDNNTYANLRFNTGPKAEIRIPTEIDFDSEFTESRHKDWDKEYDKKVNIKQVFTGKTKQQKRVDLFGGIEQDSPTAALALPEDIIAQLEDMEPAERQFVLDELACREDLWTDNESEVII
jgi:proteasome lid subunit RPN8/RPN11